VTNIRFIGAAFPRTGTFSTKIAIEKLVPDSTCYHFHEIRRYPDHVPIWNAAYDGQEPDWRSLLSPFIGTLDGPACQHWRSILEAYPDVPVLLTVRDPDEWWESMDATIYPVQNDPGNQTNPAMMMLRRTFFDGLLEGRFEDRAFTTNVYRRYCDDVRESVGAERLVEYSVAEGWPPLCKMLQCDIPNEPFPKRNSREALRRRAGLK
jgi:hypothetical protein